MEPSHTRASVRQRPAVDKDRDAGATLDDWRRFLANLPHERSLREVILASWERSSAGGLKRDGPVSFRRVSDEELATALAENRELVEVAKPHLDWISSFISGIKHVAYLTDGQGVILYSVGDMAHSDELHLAPGHDWSEQTMGTNGAGTAIAVDRPIAVVGAEHFHTAFEDCTCTGAPLHLDGRVIGAIDVSTPVKDATPDRLALVAHVGFVIDQELALRAEARQQQLYRRMADTLRAREHDLLRTNEQLEALLNNTTAVIYLVDREARLLRINRRWETLFEMSNDACAGRSLYEFFSAETADLFVANNRRVLAARHAMEFEEEATVDGEVRKYLSVKVPIFDESGEPYAVCGISTDITERHAAEQRELQILQEENARKERFVAALAHELRTPISAIMAAAEVLGHKADDRASVESASQVVKRQAMHVANLVEKLLEAARVASNPISPKRSPVDVGGVLEQAVEAVRHAVNAKRQVLEVRLPTEPLIAQGDRTRLTQVFVNLLDNASRYSEPGKQIRVEASRAGAEAIVSIRDQGRGIDPAIISKVFDLMFQAPELGGAGLGLGLSLVRGIVEAHGGSVAVHSDGISGSEFVVRLPTTACDTA